MTDVENSINNTEFEKSQLRKTMNRNYKDRAKESELGRLN